VAVRVSAAAAFTVRLSVVVCLRLPEVPVVAPLLTDRVVVTLVLKDAVTPLGMPEADSATVLSKPFCGVTVMMLDPLGLV